MFSFIFRKGLFLTGWKSNPSWAGRSVSGSLALCWVQGAWLCWQLYRALPSLPAHMAFCHGLFPDFFIAQAIFFYSIVPAAWDAGMHPPPSSQGWMEIGTACQIARAVIQSHLWLLRSVCLTNVETASFLFLFPVSFCVPEWLNKGQ